MFKDYRVDPDRKVCLQWNLKRLRNLMGLTQKEMAEMVGYKGVNTAGAIGNLECDLQKITDRFYLSVVALCYKFYESQPNSYKQIINAELTLDFTVKRAHGPNYQRWPSIYEYYDQIYS